MALCPEPIPLTKPYTPEPTAPHVKHLRTRRRIKFPALSPSHPEVISTKTRPLEPNNPRRSIQPLKADLPLLNFGRPPFDPFSPTSHRNIDSDSLHPDDSLEKRAAAHASGVGPLRRFQFQHRREKLPDSLSLIHAKMVFFPQHVRKRPVAQPMDVAKLALAAEDLLGPLAAEAERSGKRT